MDYPACGMYKELMEVFPDAKVLLTVRDPEKWYDSVARPMKTWLESLEGRLQRRLGTEVIDTIWSWRCGEQNRAVRIFEAGRKFQEQARFGHR